MMDHINTEQYCPTPFPLKPMLAHAYVPYQCMTEIYETNKALNRGTIFPELDQSEYARESVR